MEEDALVNIGLTAGSAVASLLVAYVFYLLQRRQSNSALAERVLRAKSELAEIVEDFVVNRRSIKEESISTLIAAIEREYNVDLRIACSPVTLLEDVSFRLQRSSHLNVEQKSEYQIFLDQLLEELRSRGPKSLSGDLDICLERAKQAAAAGKGDELIKELDRIATAAQNIAAAPRLYSNRSVRIMAYASVLGALVAMALAARMINLYDLPHISLMILAAVLLYSALLSLPMTVLLSGAAREEEGAHPKAHNARLVKPNPGPKADS